jgi:hypothetical protein
MEQNYGNHARQTPVWLYGVLLPFTLNFGWSVFRLIRTPDTDTAVTFLVAFALMLLWWQVRRMALTVQNRVIRLEMRLRLREILPPSLHADIQRLTVRQLVALRFASDAEMPELVNDILAGRLSDGKAIKMKVKNWQADYLRA